MVRFGADGRSCFFLGSRCVGQTFGVQIFSVSTYAVAERKLLVTMKGASRRRRVYTAAIDDSMRFTHASNDAVAKMK